MEGVKIGPRDQPHNLYLPYRYAVELFPPFPIRDDDEPIGVDITEVNSLEDFYVTLTSDRGDLKRISEYLGAEASFGLPRFDIGNTDCSFACALMPGSNIWARCKVKQVHEEDKSVTVFFIDKGRTMKLSSVNELKYLSKDFRELPGLAYHCGMDVIPGSAHKGVWDPRLCQALKDLGKQNYKGYGDPLVTARLIRKEGNKSIIEVGVHGTDTTDWAVSLVEAGFAERPPKQEGSHPNKYQRTNISSVSKTKGEAPSQQDKTCVTPSLSKTKGKAEAEPQLEPPPQANLEDDDTKSSSNVDVEDPREIVKGSIEKSSQASGHEEAVASSSCPAPKPDPIAETWKKLNHPTDLVTQEINRFRVIALTTLNTFHVVTTTMWSQDKVYLMDEINMYLDQGPVPELSEEPKIGDLVLAKRRQPAEYFRAIVVNLCTNGMARVQDVDFGIHEIVDVSFIKPMNDALRKFPVLGYRVTVNDLPEVSSKILMIDFYVLMKELLKEKFKIKVIEPPRKNGSPWRVSITLISNKKSLADKILPLGVWEWESQLKCGLKTDMAMAEESMKDTMIEKNSCFKLPLPLHEEIDVEVVTAEFSLTEPPRVVLKPLTKVMMNVQLVMEAQIESYMEKVVPTCYYPASDDFFFLYVPEGKVGGGKWHRTVRLDPVALVFYCVDTDECYGFKVNDTRYKMRRMLPEFARLPKLVFHGEFEDLEQDEETVKALRKTFVVGEKLRVSLDYIQKGGDGSPPRTDAFYVDCPRLWEILDELVGGSVDSAGSSSNGS